MNTRILDGEIIATRLDDVRAYDGVRTRRILAFLIDYLIVGLLLIPFGILVALLGLLTFGLGWSLFAILGPAVALIYVWNTLGGRNQATIGMRMMGIRLDRLDGRPVDGHAGGRPHGAVLGRQRGADAADPAGHAVFRPQAHAARPAARHGGHPRPTADARRSRCASTSTRPAHSRRTQFLLNFSRLPPR